MGTLLFENKDIETPRGKILLQKIIRVGDKIELFFITKKAGKKGSEEIIVKEARTKMSAFKKLLKQIKNRLLSKENSQLVYDRIRTSGITWYSQAKNKEEQEKKFDEICQTLNQEIQKL